MSSFEFPWRVAADFGASFELVHPDGRCVAALAGAHELERAVVGDWVTFDPRMGRVTAIAPRRSQISRARGATRQTIAANVTSAFVVTSPEPREFSPNRVVRYLIALRAGGVDPVVVLNKTDRSQETGRLVGALREIAGGAPVLPISALSGANCDALGAYLTTDATVALCGSSGVGKSTLLNRLCGEQLMETAAMRDDGRGRHTTSVRRLIVLDNGAALVDTPGMRGFAPWAAPDAVDDGFSDVTSAAARCRFGDCSHDGEPGCAVTASVGLERLQQWRKLQREAQWLRAQSDPLAARERKQRWKAIHKAMRR
jgi:ribosome biogenesis GTPase / thiamine phosphate phosphatase